MSVREWKAHPAAGRVRDQSGTFGHGPVIVEAMPIAIRWSGLSAPDLLFTIKHPTPGIVCESDMFVVGIGRGSCNQDQFAFGTRFPLSEDQEPLADAFFLIVPVNGKIGQVTGVMEVRHRARDADQFFIVPGRDHEIGIFHHPFHARPVINGSAFAKR